MSFPCLHHVPHLGIGAQGVISADSQILYLYSLPSRLITSSSVNGSNWIKVVITEASKTFENMHFHSSLGVGKPKINDGCIINSMKNKTSEESFALLYCTLFNFPEGCGWTHSSLQRLYMSRVVCLSLYVPWWPRWVLNDMSSCVQSRWLPIHVSGRRSYFYSRTSSDSQVSHSGLESFPSFCTGCTSPRRAVWRCCTGSATNCGCWWTNSSWGNLSTGHSLSAVLFTRNEPFCPVLPFVVGRFSFFCSFFVRIHYIDWKWTLWAASSGLPSWGQACFIECLVWTKVMLL